MSMSESDDKGPSPLSTCFDDDVEERWIDDQRQTITGHRVIFDGILFPFLLTTQGPFDDLPRSNAPKGLKWVDVPRTDEAYSVAISLNLDSLHDPSKTLLEQIEKQGSEAWYISLQIRYNKDPATVTGTLFGMEFHVYGPDGCIVPLSFDREYHLYYDDPGKGMGKMLYVTVLGKFVQC